MEVTPESLLIAKEEESQYLAKVGIRLAEELGFNLSELSGPVASVIMEYVRGGMGGIIYYLLSRVENEEALQAILEFSRRMAEYEPEIPSESQQALGKVIGQCRQNILLREIGVILLGKVRAQRLLSVF